MTNRTCTVEECDKAHVARGLCKTHYNQQHRKPNPTVELPCDMCGELMVKERARVGRYAHMFCDDLCKGLWYVEHGHRPPGRTSEQKPAEYPSSRLFTFECRACGMPACSQSGASRLCSNTCRNRVREARKRGRKAIRRESLFIRDDYICWMCEIPCDPDARVPDHTAPTIDHIVPRSLGGGDEPDNLATACFMCNTLRGASWEIPTRTLVR
jgi:5-methylcytosine-specific restriction endonuclease McrA